MQVQFFKTQIGKLILVKEMNCIYEVTRGFKSVFVSKDTIEGQKQRLILARLHIKGLNT
jgi:hypothetical protein